MTPPLLTDYLTDAGLHMLRAGYDGAAMKASARAATAVPYPPAAPFTNFVIDEFYDAGKLPPAVRERVLIALEASRLLGSGRTLAVHLYWGLMEGLSVTDAAAILLLTGAYSGMDVYSAALGVFVKLLRDVLAAAVTLGAEACTTQALGPRIAATFP